MLFQQEMRLPIDNELMPRESDEVDGDGVVEGGEVDGDGVVEVDGVVEGGEVDGVVEGGEVDGDGVVEGGEVDGEGEVVEGAGDGEVVEGGEVDARMKMLLGKRDELFQTVKSNIEIAQQKQRETYDRKHLPEEISAGTEVLIENTAQKDRKGGKLDDAFNGPYIIHKSLGKGIYKVKNQKGAILQKKVNVKRLKVYKRRDVSRV